MKPDIISSKDPSRSVNVEIHELAEHYYLALPGKATEVPYLSDELVRILYTKFNKQFSDMRIAERPGEKYNLRKVKHD